MKKRSGYGIFELIVGILLAVLGIVSFFKPDAAVTWVVILYGVFAVVVGISDILLYVKAERYTGFGPVTSLITGIFSIMAGFMLLVYPDAGKWIFVFLLPVWFIAHCVSRLAQLNMIRFVAGDTTYRVVLLLNIIGILLGTLMILRPVLSFVAAGVVIGAYLIVTGIDMIITAVGKMGSK